MATDPVLAILALLFFWLLVRLRASGSSDAPGQNGRRPLKLAALNGARIIETLPSRPLAFGATVSIPGDSDEEGPCSVNLSELTCNCQDFRATRAALPPESVGRICSHLSEALRTTGATGAMDDLLQAIVESGATRRVYYELPLSGERTVAVGHTPGEDSLEIFAEPRPKDRSAEGAPEAFRRYGYSRARGRWLNDERPPGSGRIMELLPGLPFED